VRLRDPDGRLTVVPFDFDFAGLVNAGYAEPAPQLPIRSVTTRLYRGFCRPGVDWQAVRSVFAARRADADAPLDATPGLTQASRNQMSAFLDEFYATLASPRPFEQHVTGVCRPAP